MRILFYGAGVLGSLYAARLQDAGHDVTILARGKRLSDIREHGIVLEESDTGKRTATRIDVVESLAPDAKYDLIVVLMRRNQVSAILPSLAANKNSPTVLFMNNNVSGPEAMVKALGMERVLLGFPGAAGHRDGHVITVKITSGRQQPTTMGELDGQTTTRLKDIAETLKSAGFPVAISPNMDAWLKTHVAEVSPAANAIYLAGGDNYRLARTRDGVVLMIRAIREGFRVLRELDIAITPGSHQFVMEWLPEPILVPLVQRLLDTETAEIEVAGHANAARDEFTHLAEELQVLARSTTVPTPAMDRLCTYLDPDVSPLPEGSGEISLSWRNV